ncbi:MAG: hypothetical protein LC714_02870 [Actinobacteria bacterium]|nr:hypothetical protein [Actinomycetota bacterium]
MTLNQASAIVAIGSALVAVLVTLYGLLERKRTFESQQRTLKEDAERWRATFEAERRSQEVILKKEFLFEQYRFRLAAYGDVMRTLGAVSDVDFRRDPASFMTAADTPELLLSTAAGLYDHLYSQPGLLMTMETRSVFHHAREQCIAFLAGNKTIKDAEDLTDAFFYARRYLRADLELLDDRDPESLQKLVKELVTTTSSPKS